jgi:hypothetical protein
LHPYKTGKTTIREEIKNRLILGMPAIMPFGILSFCLLFKNEVHRATALLGGMGLAYVKCVREWGAEEGIWV